MVSHTTLWLLLLSATAAWAKTAADFFVTSLPGQPEGPLLRQYAGHIEVTPEHNGHLWFWRFENRHLANRHRTVLWLNGGPGCSSLDGALMEIGPYRLANDSALKYNEGSWDEFANLLFIDNPVGTGFSYVNTDSYVKELQEMADQMVTFLDEYFKIFPGESLNDLYIAGESYAGQHIPYIANTIVERNKKNENAVWNLKGLLIGNGWVSPEAQSPAYLEMAYKVGIVEKGSPIADDIEAQQTRCEAQLAQFKATPQVSYPDCEEILGKVLSASTQTQNRNGRCVNMYDVRLDDVYDSCGMNWPPDLVNMKPYLRRDDVKSALHVDDAKKSGWVECDGQVGAAFRPAHSRPSIELLPGLLEADIPILLFSGDQDLICNHYGTETLINDMSWNNGKGFEISPGVWAPRQDWTYEGEPAGFYQSARNLTYVLFYNASHMVPFDYPRRSRDMLDRFVGVDIASIGGKPADSRIDGEKLPDTSVGGHTNSTQATEEQKEKIDKAKWAAYYRSGAIALVVVSALAAFFAWYVWQDRRRRAGYTGIYGGSASRLMGEGSIMRRDVEQADFDENELDDLESPKKSGHDMEGNRYSLGGLSDEEEEEDKDAFQSNKHGSNGAVNGT